jgi:predicted ATPase/DNA-binding XRE family transcriptional regulator/Tfp pilus assembly protein PilF
MHVSAERAGSRKDRFGSQEQLCFERASMSNRPTFGSRLKQLRQEHGLTQDALAERVGCATQTIRKIEGGQRRPSYQIAARLAEQLGIAPEDRASFIRSARDEPREEQIELPAQPVSEARPASLLAPGRNLPTPLTRLIGRQQEVRSARQLLLRENVRLLTLIGPGGTGKTRLGVEVAAGVEDHFDAGAIFVNLVPIRDPALVVPTIADAVGIGEEGGQPRLERLKEGLGMKRLLLVLDNFEQVIPAAGLLADLLSSCPELKALVTSREVLRVRGEYLFTVHPLPVLVSKRATASELVSQSAAVQLFIERAVAAKPDFAITDENAPAIAELCQRLDGLPLAIELAAARSTLFPPEALLARLASRLQLLTAGPRDVPVRQQTLRNTIAWSYDLLTESEQKLFRRLCIFNGGRSLDAIAAVCTAAGDLDGELVDRLGSLVDKSLLWQDARASREPWFLMLETIREYGLEQLEHSGEAEVTRRAHAYYYVQLVEQAESHLWGGDQARTLDRLEQEHDNLRVALAWHIAHEEGVEPALWMAGLLWRFWSMRGHWTEGQRWLEQALSRRAGAASVHRWITLHGAGNLSFDLGEYTRAKAYYEESLALTQRLNNQRGIANSLLNLSLVAYHQGDLEQAIALQEQALAIHRALDNRVGTALAINNMAMLLEEAGDYDRAAGFVEEGLARYQDLGDSLGMAQVLHVQALLAYRRSAYEHAITLFKECCSIYTKLGAKNDLARALNDLGKLHDDQGEYERARALYEESLRLADELGDRRRQAAVLNNLGRLTQRMGDKEGAVMLYNKSLSLQRDLGDKRGIAMVLESMGQVEP